MPASLATRNTTVLDTSFASTPAFTNTVGTWTRSGSPNRYTCNALGSLSGLGMVSMSAANSPSTLFNNHGVEATVSQPVNGCGVFVNGQAPSDSVAADQTRAQFTLRYLDDLALVNEEGWYWELKINGSIGADGGASGFFAYFPNTKYVWNVSLAKVSDEHLNLLTYANVAPFRMTLISSPLGWIAMVNGTPVATMRADDTQTSFDIIDSYYRGYTHAGLITRTVGFEVTALKIVKGNGSPYQSVTSTFYSDNFDRANGAYSYAGAQTFNSTFLDSASPVSAYSIVSNCLAWTQQMTATEFGTAAPIIQHATSGQDVPFSDVSVTDNAETYNAYRLAQEIEFVYDGGTFLVGANMGDGLQFNRVLIAPTGITMEDYYKGAKSAEVEGSTKWTGTLTAGDTVRIRFSGRTVPFLAYSMSMQLAVQVWVNGTSRFLYYGSNEFKSYSGVQGIVFANQSGVSTQNKIRSLVYRRLAANTVPYTVDFVNFTGGANADYVTKFSYRLGGSFTGARKITRKVRV